MEDPAYKLLSTLSILIFFILVFGGLYLLETTASVLIPVTVQAANIALIRLQLINQTYGSNSLMQIVISEAQNNIIAIVNSQNSAITQVVNRLLYIEDLFHNLLSIKDFLEIFVVPLIISIIIIIYIYKYI